MATADIKEIDYDQIVAKASNIAKKADQMQKAVQLAFKEINQMRENWFGLSYDNFINTVNKTIKDLNKLFETTVSDIPHEIAAKAKSYATANDATISTGLSEQTAIILQDFIPTNKGTKLRFRETEVRSDQKQININFQDAQTFAQNARAEASSLEDVWKSGAGDTNIQELKDAFDKVIKILEGLDKSLDNFIEAQAGRINRREAQINAVESIKDVIANAIDAAQDEVQSAVNKMKQDAAQSWKNELGRN